MFKKFIAASVLIALVAPASAQQNLDEVQITTEVLAPGVAAMFGAGGNLATSYGEDGTVLIDDDFAPMSDKISIAIEQLGGNPSVAYLVNTHWHWDHTGGNENFGNAGATIFAHENVRVRMSTEQMRGENVVEASPKAALPVVTFERGVTLHLNGDTIDVIFLGGGHTDGDSIVRWREDNVVHMGDLYFNLGGWPYVDLKSGGDVTKLLFALDTSLTMMNDDTKVIPGHGPMSNAAELRAQRDIIGEAVTRVRALKDVGMTLEQAQAEKPLASFGRREAFVTEDSFVAAIWASLD